MMRVCHLNTCPVGIATQDPGCASASPGCRSTSIALQLFVADDVRERIAALGFRRFEDADRAHRPAPGGRDASTRRALDLSALLRARGARRPEEPHDTPRPRSTTSRTPSTTGSSSWPRPRSAGTRSSSATGAQPRPRRRRRCSPASRARPRRCRAFRRHDPRRPRTERPGSRSAPGSRAGSRCACAARPTTTWARVCPAGASCFAPRRAPRGRRGERHRRQRRPLRGDLRRAVRPRHRGRAVRRAQQRRRRRRRGHRRPRLRVHDGRPGGLLGRIGRNFAAGMSGGHRLRPRPTAGSTRAATWPWWGSTSSTTRTLDAP